jgi:dTDP-4-dehydrorhamnose 3,5-epimerase
MIFKETDLKGSYLVDIEPKNDSRGFFARYFCEREFSSLGLNTTWRQINNSLTINTGTLRGLHFQVPPHSETKLVRCVQGSIWDVIVDLRAESPCYGQWFGTELSAENRRMMYVPPGFAHGFISLQPRSEIIYLVSTYYNPDAERTLLWCDEDASISWPIEPKEISPKDSQGLPLSAILPVSIR